MGTIISLIICYLTIAVVFWMLKKLTKGFTTAPDTDTLDVATEPASPAPIEPGARVPHA